MTKTINLICIACPIGCDMIVTLENNEVVKAEGNSCKRGIVYAKAECINPTRILPTTVKVENGTKPLVSVKSASPLPKNMILECMKVINKTVAIAPIKIGDVLIENILNLGVDIVATNVVQKQQETQSIEQQLVQQKNKQNCLD